MYTASLDFTDGEGFKVFESASGGGWEKHTVNEEQIRGPRRTYFRLKWGRVPVPQDGHWVRENGYYIEVCHQL